MDIAALIAALDALPPKDRAWLFMRYELTLPTPVVPDGQHDPANGGFSRNKPRTQALDDVLGEVLSRYGGQAKPGLLFQEAGVEGFEAPEVNARLAQLFAEGKLVVRVEHVTIPDGGVFP